MDESGSREIEAAVQKALEAGGIRGTVTLSGRTLTLRAGSSPVEIDAMYLVEQWPLLPEDLRERKAADIAVRLAEADKAAKAGVSAAPAARYIPSTKPTGKAATNPGRPIVVPLGTLVLLTTMGLAIWMFLKPESRPDPNAGANTARPETEDERRARVCEVARKRVLETGTLAALDAEVWLTELWLATSKPGDFTRSAALAVLVDHGKLTSDADPDLAALRDAQIEISNDDGAGAFRAARVRFRGGYVSAFFDTAGREKMNRVASRLADATGAELGAFYGRCAHLRYHDVGAWFRGATPALTSAAIVYAMGFFSERRTTNRDPSVPPTAADLAALHTTFSKLDRSTLEKAVRDAGGVYAPGVGDAPSVVSFPLLGPTRATRASGLLATAAGIGADSPRPSTTP